MAIEIQGQEFFTSGDVARAVGVSRQTLWRWRQEGKVPAGRRYRNGQIVFSVDEFEAVRQHANRLDPISLGANGNTGASRSLQP